MSEKVIIECTELPMDIIDGAEYIIYQQNPNNYTHSYFKYPCKFIPEIPRWFLKKYINERETILDPFAGSGTTLLESSICNVKSFGIEINNLSLLISKVKTYKLNEYDKQAIEKFISLFDENIEVKYPKIDNLNHWFDKEECKKLSVIKTNISRIEDERIKDFLNVCFISIIRKCSKADNVSPKPYVSKRIIKKKV